MHRFDQSFGIIAVRRNNGHLETFLVHHQKGHWAFPKGHAEGSESPKEAAAREFEEETGGKILNFLDIPFLEENYSFKDDEGEVIKRVQYFFATVRDAGCSLQHQEVNDCRWLSFDEAEKLATFPESKKLCKKAFQLLTERNLLVAEP